jgi:hypothetical protein
MGWNVGGSSVTGIDTGLNKNTWIQVPLYDNKKPQNTGKFERNSKRCERSYRKQMLIQSNKQIRCSTVPYTVNKVDIR